MAKGTKRKSPCLGATMTCPLPATRLPSLSTLAVSLASAAAYVAVDSQPFSVSYALAVSSAAVPVQVDVS